MLFSTTTGSLGNDNNTVEYNYIANTKGIREIRLVGEVGNGSVAKLYNGLGQVVLTKKLGAGSQNIIGLPNLGSGVYMLKINDKGAVQTIKVMVKK